MVTCDTFTEYYARLLDDTYDVVDRIVINAYNGFACSPGGFRCWWHDLHGTFDNLDDTRLMRMAVFSFTTCCGNSLAHRVKAGAGYSQESLARVAEDPIPNLSNQGVQVHSGTGVREWPALGRWAADASVFNALRRLSFGWTAK